MVEGDGQRVHSCCEKGPFSIPRPPQEDLDADLAKLGGKDEIEEIEGWNWSDLEKKIEAQHAGHVVEKFRFSSSFLPGEREDAEIITERWIFGSDRWVVDEFFFYPTKELARE